MNKKTRTKKEWDTVIKIILLVVLFVMALAATFERTEAEELGEGEKKVPASIYLIQIDVWSMPLTVPPEMENSPPEVLSLGKMVHVTCIDTAYAVSVIVEKTVGSQLPDKIIDDFIHFYNTCIGDRSTILTKWKQYQERKLGIGSF